MSEFKYKIIDGIKKIVLANRGGTLRAPCTCCCGFLEFQTVSGEVPKKYKYAAVKITGNRTITNVQGCWTTSYYTFEREFCVVSILEVVNCEVNCVTATGTTTSNERYGGSGFYCDGSGGDIVTNRVSNISNCMETTTITTFCPDPDNPEIIVTSTEFMPPLDLTVGINHIKINVSPDNVFRSSNRNIHQTVPFSNVRLCPTDDPAFLTQESYSETGTVTTDIYLYDEPLVPTDPLYNHFMLDPCPTP